MSLENNKNGSATIESLLSIEDNGNKTNGNKQPEPESLLVPTKHTFVTSPWSRLLVITVPFGLGFLAIFFLLNGLFNPPTAEKIVQKTEETTKDEQAQQNEEGDGDARAKLALSEQENELGKVNNQKQLQPVPVSKTSKVVSSNPPPPRPAQSVVQNSSPPPRTAPRTAPPPIRSYTPPTRTSFSPRPSFTSISTPTVALIDPLQQLNKLRTIGSYGKIAYTESSTSDQPLLDPSLHHARQSN